MSLTAKILFGMLLGIILGSTSNFIFQENLPTFLNFFSEFIDALGTIFLSLLKLLVVPLVFVSLVVGVSNLTSDRQLLSISSKAIILYLFTTALAIISALFVSSFFEMANGVSMVSDSSFKQDAIPSLKDTLVNLFPTNPIESMAKGLPEDPWVQALLPFRMPRVA